MDRRIYFSLIIIFFSLQAHSNQKTDREIGYQIAETQRQALIARNLPIHDGISESFWDLYRDYRERVRKLDNIRSELLKRLSTVIDKLESREGRSLVNSALEVEKERQNLKKRYFGKFAKILNGPTLFRYYQIETKLDAQYRFGWTRMIPLAPVESKDSPKQ